MNRTNICKNIVQSLVDMGITPHTPTQNLSRLSIYSDKPSEMPYFKRY